MEFRNYLCRTSYEKTSLYLLLQPANPRIEAYLSFILLLALTNSLKKPPFTAYYCHRSHFGL